MLIALTLMKVFAGRGMRMGSNSITQLAMKERSFAEFKERNDEGFLC